MPTYDYECTSCGYTFEVFQSMSDEPLKKCPECGKKVQRLIGGGEGDIFKGSGFYVNDRKKNSPTGTSTATKEEKGKDEKGGNTKDGEKTSESKNKTSSGKKKSA